jgi:preprotein translocase subunit SecD
MYEVLGEAATPPTSYLDASHMVIAYDRRKYSQAPENEPLSYVTIDRDSFVPLLIEGTPRLGTDPNGRSMLSITLARDQAKRLEDFTRAHLGGRVATILDGEIITLNKIRAVITGGEVQMTRCTDEACQFVRAKLVK